MIDSARILSIEDDREMAHMIGICLRHEGHRILHAQTGEDGLELAAAQRPDLVVLDVGLPGISGVEVCRRLRAMNFDAPILMLTSNALIEDRVQGLNAGADDYLTKPFAVPEFLARVNALLRRGRRVARPTVLRLGDVEIDLAQKKATRAGQPLALTKTEFALLDLLARHPDQPVSRERMLDVVWGYTRFPTTRTIDTHIWRLRKKLGDEGDAPRWLQPVHGQGYRLVLDPAP